MKWRRLESGAQASFALRPGTQSYLASGLPVCVRRAPGVTGGGGNVLGASSSPPGDR